MAVSACIHHLRLFGVALLAMLALGPARAQDDGAHVAIACGALGIELELCRDAAQEWAAKTGNTVEIVNTPNSSSDRFQLYVQLLSSQSADIDVLQIDVVWAGMLESHLADLEAPLGKRVDRMFPALGANNRVNGKLVAVPWYIDAGVLYYRKDLLAKYGYQPPETWDQLTRTAAAIQQAERRAGNQRMWGYVFQAKAYEGLTCNALEWVSSYGGGSFLDLDRQFTADNPQARAALNRAAGWIGTIAPRGVLNYDEEASRGVFQTGNAVFMRNWPYAWALAQGEESPVRGKVGVVALPKGGPNGESAAALGGWHLAVSRYSRHRAEAIDLVKYLTSAQEQKRRAIKGAYNPTLTALYDDPEVIEANPFFATLYPAFENAVARPARPAGARYNQVSDAIWRASYDVLQGDSKAGPALTRLEDEIARIAYRARWNEAAR
ncbi:ABC transporter substrate-binding protein [Croceicoccus bisphenolivorans]|uniref:ABC transporter substrate-binding protein n=1 Tax=Croceicoccus bisphenolivorans TaxID=1783232 RepID=UPI000833737B|nr:ABC transporter substrate-binding protein [Croceicoccus bisphenolivorans]